VKTSNNFAEEEYRLYMSAVAPDMSATVSLKQECDKVERKFNEATDADRIKAWKELLLALLATKKSVCNEVENFERKRLLLRKQRTSRGLQELLTLLDILVGEIKDAKPMETVRRTLDMEFLGRIQFWTALQSSSLLLDTYIQSGDQENANQVRNFMLKISDRERKQLEEELEATKRRETFSREAKLLSLSLPAPEVSELVMRMLASIDREFTRACNQLECLQRQRKGESVPAPVTVSMN
jgi:hypothetical protein